MAKSVDLVSFNQRCRRRLPDIHRPTTNASSRKGDHVMDDHDLSAEELALLQAETSTPEAVQGAGDATEPAGRWGYDRQDPAEIRRQLDVLESFHQDVANRFADTLSRGLQRLVEVQLTEVRSMAFSQFAFSRPNPTCYFVLAAAPLPSNLALDLSPALLYPILDCLLGGGKQAFPLPQRPPTELEQRLAKRVVRMLLDELHDAWEPLLAVNLSIERIESQAQRVRVVAPGEGVATLTFQARVAEQSGELTLCLPHRAIRKIVDKLLVGEFHGGDAAALQLLPGTDGEAELTAYFDAESISATELDNLRVGDVLLSDLDIDGLIDVSVDGRPTFKARPGAAQGRRAIALVSKSA